MDMLLPFGLVKIMNCALQPETFEQCACAALGYALRVVNGYNKTYTVIMM